MTDKKHSTYRYFILEINEYFKREYYRLENRKVESLRKILLEYINLEKEIQSNLMDKGKLERSKKALDNTLIYFFQKTLLGKNNDLERDIKNLVALMKNDGNKEECIEERNNEANKNRRLIYYAITSLYKKIEKLSILDFWINIILTNELSFEEIDIVLDCYVSELLYEGYSLEFLKEWWSHSFRALIYSNDIEQLEAGVNKFKELSKKENYHYNLIVKLSLPKAITDEINKNIENIIEIDSIKYSILSDREKDEYSKNNKKFFESTKVQYLKVDIDACDQYSAIEQALYPIENYIEVYKVIDDSMSNVRINTCLIISVDIGEYDPEKFGAIENYTEISLVNIRQHIKEFSSREKDDIRDFIDLRDQFRQKKNYMGNISEIGQVINIIQKSTEFTRENRLLNYWNCMENILRSYKANSIIEKVNNIIPKVICMYIVKQKLNIFWEQLNPLLGKRIVEENLEKCKKTNGKYSLESLLEYLFDETKSENIYNLTEYYITLNRKICELHKFVNEPMSVLNYIEDMEKVVSNNITSIYRTRNNLVHNGGLLDIHMQYQTDTLQYYLSCILGTLIYHIKRNPELTICEILYSIIQTYKSYINDLKGLCNSNNKKSENDKRKNIEKFGLRNLAKVEYLYI
ncbi:hypothetical protein [Clostridium butyricum]|uniref:hypothetical protein n=1 Tax=Clostridium butyricum TaxID=1492 RepID=UPI00374F438D